MFALRFYLVGLPMDASLIGPGIVLAVNLVTVAVGYGMLRARVSTNEGEIRLLREKQESVATKDDIARIERRLDTVLSAVLRDHK